MSQESDNTAPTADSCTTGHDAGLGDSAGVPWAGRRFEPNHSADDDGSADPALLDALLRFRAGSASQVDVVNAFRTARVLIPLVAERGDEGIGPTGLLVDKTQELSIVTVAAPDGRRVQPVFSSVEAMGRWDPMARPIPVASTRAALAAVDDDTDLIVLDPISETEFIIRRPAVWAIAQDHSWEPSFLSPEVFAGLQESIAHELSVIDIAVLAGDPDARLLGPELIVILDLIDGLDSEVLQAVLARLAQRWASDDRIAVLADSLTVKLRRSPQS